jgi:tRNA(Arg) A34 adenosine deaminase TadA
MILISDACKKLNTVHFTTCIIYSTCEPCPMCFLAIYWVRPKAVYYGSDKADAIDFDDQFL